LDITGTPPKSDMSRDYETRGSFQDSMGLTYVERFIEVCFFFLAQNLAVCCRTKPSVLFRILDLLQTYYSLLLLLLREDRGGAPECALPHRAT
jgi:hypothetical protein